MVLLNTFNDMNIKEVDGFEMTIIIKMMAIPQENLFLRYTITYSTPTAR